MDVYNNCKINLGNVFIHSQQLQVNLVGVRYR